MHPLKPFQSEALATLEKYSHVLCVAPTGAGKSLIYEKAATKRGRRTLLISPLVALARQQRARLTQLETDTWIMSPESAIHCKTLMKLREWRPNLLVVDECHCLWDWGDSFRPAFRELPQLIGRLQIKQSLWLTATLPPRDRQDLLRALGPNSHSVGAFDLPTNLKFQVLRVPWAQRSFALLRCVRDGQGLVFCATREMTERLARLLQSQGIRAAAYHAGLAREERLAIETRIEKKKTQVVVATTAFGMGIHYSGLNWVVLWQPPVSLVRLTQMIGRVGRNGDLIAHAAVFWDEGDFRMLDWAVRDIPRKKDDLADLRDFLKTEGCRPCRLRTYFRGSPSPCEAH